MNQHNHQQPHAHDHNHDHGHNHDPGPDQAHEHDQLPVAPGAAFDQYRHPHPHQAGRRHEHGPGQDHDHDHPHDHDHDHDPDQEGGVWGWISRLLHLHGHSHQHVDLATDEAFLSHELGIRTVWIALAALLVTAGLQIVVVTLSGSVALLGDTVHNIGDGLNSLPLLIAFYLARRVATRRYNYGYARAEDIAGIFIVISIGFSAFFILRESIARFINPQPLTNLGWLAAAALIGFLGNELVAVLQIRVGRQIGSAAMVADGQHARTDGLTSLAVLVAAGGTALGYPILDPIIGLLIGVTILFITWDATKQMWYRLMDAVEPDYLDRAEAVINGHRLVRTIGRVRMRWVGHRLHAEVTVAVDPALSLAQSHQIVEELRHDLFHAFPNLAEIIVHPEPDLPALEEAHELTLHHEPVPRQLNR